MSDQAPFIPSAPDQDPIPPAPWRVFRTPGFPLLFGAQFVSSLGDWTGLLAIIAIASKVSGSGTGIGLVMIARMLPGFVLAPIGGVLARPLEPQDGHGRLRHRSRAGCSSILPFWDNLLGLVVHLVPASRSSRCCGVRPRTRPCRTSSRIPTSSRRRTRSGSSPRTARSSLGAVFFAILAGVSKWLGDIHYLGRFHQQSIAADLGRRAHVPRLGAPDLRGCGSTTSRARHGQAGVGVADVARHRRRAASSCARIRSCAGVMVGLAGGLIGGGHDHPARSAVRDRRARRRRRRRSAS